MYRALFSNWKFALLWAIGISASVAAFFADGGGHEQLEVSAQQIREKRSNPDRQDAQAEEPVAAPAPAPSAVPASEEEDEEPAFGEPSLDPGMDGGEQAALPGPATQQPAEGEAEF
jgi:hypothetical protein